jgi:tRNA uridine 5-carbamoylmethylation protein Kti12
MEKYETYEFAKIEKIKEVNKQKIKDKDKENRWKSDDVKERLRECLNKLVSLPVDLATKIE